MYHNILVPYDGSEHAQHALEAAIELGEGDSPVKITVLNVTDLMDFDDSTFEIAARMAGVPPISDSAAKQARENYFSEHKKSVQEQIQDFFEGVPENIDIQIAVVGGHPQEAITQYANDGEFDCIVMGRRGLGALRGALGSVSFAVLRSVELPVLVVK